MKDISEKSLTSMEFTIKEKDQLDREERKYQRLLKKELIKLDKRKKKQELREISEQYKYVSEGKQKRTTTKVLMYFILANCTMIEIYSMIVMFVLKDLSALYSLIGAVIGQSVSYAIYCTKSFKETKEEAINSLERDKFNASLQSNYSYEDESQCDDIVLMEREDSSDGENY